MAAKYRNNLPQLETFLMTDGGIETDLIFNRGWDLPAFASFPLLASEAGRAALDAYTADYLDIARTNGIGLLLETFTWRANPDWATSIGYSLEEMDQFNRDSVSFLEELRAGSASDLPHLVISGCIGPWHDGYVAGSVTPAEAQAYHSRQINVFAETGADLVSAITMTNVEEALGVVGAAVAAEMPVVISFTVETDGRLPSGQPLGEAITQVDTQTDGAPAYFMINCAHPTHFAGTLEEGGEWTSRIRGLRTNASKMSHAELDEAETLDIGDPVELGTDHLRLQALLPDLAILGGCCGTDSRHIREVVSAWRAA
jgi:homocysteine S-methyltransferase